MISRRTEGHVTFSNHGCLSAGVSKLAVTFKARYGQEGSNLNSGKGTVLWQIANSDRTLRVPTKVLGFECVCRLGEVSGLMKAKESANITNTKQKTAKKNADI